MTVQAFKRRFDELLVQIAALVEKQREDPSAHDVGDDVDAASFLGWCVNARNLLLHACGAELEHYKAFQIVERRYGQTQLTAYKFMLGLRAVVLAAREDYAGGYLRSVGSLVHAQLFNDELEQARELHASGYNAAAAVVAGVVLETTLRKLCGDNGIAVAKLGKMNADLAKAGFYNVLVQKRVTMLADIRNKAAHGDTASFTDADVTDMIAQVERFVSDYPTG